MYSENKNYLITGVKSGLGKYLYQNIPNSVGLTRENRQKTIDQCRQLDNLTVLHCAFNAKRDIEDHYRYLEDNILLTSDLLSIPHHKFVYFSSIDVYKEFTPYSFTKKLAEGLVAEKSNNYLILRLSALLGPSMRKNSLIKILDGKSNLTLSCESTFNYILQSDIIDTLQSEIVENLVGTYNFVSSTNTTLNEVAEYYNKKVIFGKFKYETNLGPSNGMKNINPKKERTSLETIGEYLKECYE